MAWYYDKVFELTKLPKFKNIPIVTARECLLKYMTPSRLLGMDYGRRHVGLAVSDYMHETSSAYITLRSFTVEKLARYLSFNEDLRNIWHRPSLLIVGYPLEKDATEGEQCEEVLNFLLSVKNCSKVCPFDNVLLWDERMSTTAVYYQYFIPQQLHIRWSGAKRKQVVDEQAAQYILQDA